MANTIKIKRGSGTPSSLQTGELGLNTSTNEIFVGDSNGNAVVPTNSKYLPLSGGVMTGPIYFAGTKATYPMIKWIDNTSDPYGNGISIGGGGVVVIGAGESSDEVVNNSGLNGGTETLYLCSDEGITFVTNCQNGYSSATITTIDTSGNFSGKAAGITGILPIENGGTGASNRIDAANNLAFNSMTVVNYISDGVDLNDYKIPGIYVSNSSANNISHNPFDTGAFRLEVYDMLGRYTDTSDSASWQYIRQVCKRYVIGSGATEYERDIYKGYSDEAWSCGSWYIRGNPVGSLASTYMTKTNPTGTGSFSLNRKADTTVGSCSFAEGYGTTASGYQSHAEGYNTVAENYQSHAEGNSTTASGENSHAEGYNTTASGHQSHAEGGSTVAENYQSHAEGRSTTASGENSHAEGYNTTASGHQSHAEGYNTVAENYQSHAEGNSTTASGQNSHAEGANTTASEWGSHAEGYETTASNFYTHAEGYNTTASGTSSHAEGYNTTASGWGSHAAGCGTTALNYQYAIGHYNNTTTATAASSTSGSSTGTAFVIGNGTSSSASNAFRVTYEGAIYANNSITSTGRDYAEYFEWQDSNPDSEDRRGYFVTLDEDKIKIAEPNDYILGIVSGQPSVIGNSDECWRGRYLLDDFGAYIIEEFEYEEADFVEVVDEETGEPKVEKKFTTKTGTKYKENPDYDPSLSYTQRADRPEWNAVGMLGVLSVRDDGTCEVNGFCTVAEGGIATASDSGYRVIERVSENVVKVIFK